MKRITRLKIVNYRGVRALDAKISPSGAVIKGTNGEGKTSVLRAIRAALVGQDISADAITIGEERAEVLLDVGDVSVHRTITEKTTTLKVSRDGMFAPKPQTFLNDLLGNSALDPIDLLQKRDTAELRRERRALILKAMPMTVTVEQLRKWAPVHDDVDTSGHGLDVLERVRKFFYDQRTIVNKQADEANREHRRLADLLEATPLTVGPSREEAEAEFDAARGAAAALHQREVDAEAAEKRQKQARESLTAMRAEASEMRDKASKIRRPEEDEKRAACDAKAAEIKQLQQNIAELQRKLTDERKRHTELCAELDACVDVNQQADKLEESAVIKERGASEIEYTLNVTVAHVSHEELAAITARVEQARAGVATARARGERADLEKKLSEARGAAGAVTEKADKLSEIISRLTNEAPGELVSASNGIAGLELDGDKVFLDGVDIDKLSGRERMAFAIRLAKRLNAKSKILVVDGLEQIGPDNMDAFLRMATEDSWQLIATRVDRGDIVIEAIELDAPPSGERYAAGGAR